MKKCSQCNEPSEHSILVRKKNPNDPKGPKDLSGVHVIRFCTNHWNELQECLPKVA